MQFDSEQQLVETALQTDLIKEITKDRQSTIITEPRGLFGRPDVAIGIIVERESGTQLHTFAFEMKLSNWKQALAQAFRYRAFAYKSYVVLDAKYVHRALKYRIRFEKSNIGLVSVGRDGSVNIYNEPKALEPYSIQLQIVFTEMLQMSLSIPS